MEDTLRILALLALVGGNAFFVIGEYSVVTARRTPLAERAAAGSGRARAALRLMDDPVRVISTVQVGITAVGILSGAVGEPVVRDLLGDGVPHWLSFVIAFGTVTYLSVVFGELVPKALTLDRAERLAALVAPPIELMARVLRPVVWVLQGSAALRAAAVRRDRGDRRGLDPLGRRAARARGRGGAVGRDPARAGGAAAQRVRLPRPRGARRDDAGARRRLARRRPDAGRGARPRGRRGAQPLPGRPRQRRPARGRRARARPDRGRRGAGRPRSPSWSGRR